MIAIIPARGGSKGVPGKNIKDLHGKPLIAYTIEAALEARSVSEVIVSTDDEEIAKVAEKYGAKVPFLRPAALATDNAQAIDSYIYTVDRLNEEFGYDIDSFLVLLLTTPFRNGADIDASVKMFKEQSADSVISYVEECSPINGFKYLNDDNSFEHIFPEVLANRQEMRKAYIPNGAIYVFTLDLLKKGTYFSDKSYAYVMPQSRSIDIDTLEDFAYAEFLLSRKEK
jgi:N-acylneuraminate cytidylyltransferase/CMP-N,N'-diacetyllegionaminic acid synthase